MKCHCRNSVCGKGPVTQYIIAGTSVFLAYGVVPINGTDSIRFPYIYYNVGNDYDPSTGVYTCPITGTYWISASLGKLPRAQEHVDCKISVNHHVNIAMLLRLYTNNTQSAYTVSISGGFYLRKGDRVQVGFCRDKENIANAANTYFSGVLLRPDA